MAIVETKIDEFVDEVIRKGKLSFGEAAKILGVPPEKVKEWAYILDKHKEETGIEVYYPTVGEPEIVSTISKKKAEISKRVSSLKERKKELEDEFGISTKESKTATTVSVPKREEVKELTSNLSEKVDELEKFEKDVKSMREELSEVEASVEKAESEEERILSKLEADKKEMDETEKELSHILKELDGDLSKAEKVQGALSHIKKEKKEIPKEVGEMKSEVSEIEEEIREVEKESKKLDKRKISRKIKDILKI